MAGGYAIPTSGTYRATLEQHLLPMVQEGIFGRTQFFVLESNVNNGRCGYCGKKIAGVFA